MGGATGRAAEFSSASHPGAARDTERALTPAARGGALRGPGCNEHGGNRSTAIGDRVIPPVRVALAGYPFLFDVHHLPVCGDLTIPADQASALESSEPEEANQTHQRPPADLECKFHALRQGALRTCVAVLPRANSEDFLNVCQASPNCSRSGPMAGCANMEVHVEFLTSSRPISWMPSMHPRPRPGAPRGRASRSRRETLRRVPDGI
jgi:hypothetical protein